MTDKPKSEAQEFMAYLCRPGKTVLENMIEYTHEQEPCDDK